MGVQLHVSRERYREAEQERLKKRKTEEESKAERAGTRGLPATALCEV